MQSEPNQQPNQQPGEPAQPESAPSFVESLCMGAASSIAKAHEALNERLRGVGIACEAVAANGRAIIDDAGPSTSFVDLCDLGEKMTRAAADQLNARLGADSSPGADSSNP